MRDSKEQNEVKMEPNQPPVGGDEGYISSA